MAGLAAAPLVGAGPRAPLAVLDAEPPPKVDHSAAVALGPYASLVTPERGLN